MKKLVLLGIGIVFLVVVFGAWSGVVFLSKPPSRERREVIFEVPAGASFYKITEELVSQGLVTDGRMFRIYAKLTAQTTKVKVGEYRLYADMLPREVMHELISGRSVAYTLTVPEGYNIFDIRETLNGMWSGRGDEFFAKATNSQFAKSLTGKDIQTLEGYLFPDTYVVTKFTGVTEIIRNMYRRFEQEIEIANKARKINMDLHQQVILASVIEKETGAPEERQIISSVFHNRLARRIRLQSDPTILYGILMETKEMKKNITKEDILRPTPYNTYTVPALPVGPVSNPGRAALHAAVNPIDSKYLFFVSKNDGTHVFTENYEEHSRAVRNFQINRRAREGKSWRDLNKKATN